MTRTSLLVAGAIAWTVACVDAAAHLVSGDLLAPIVMSAVFAVWVGLRRYQIVHRHEAIAVEALSS